MLARYALAIGRGAHRQELAARAAALGFRPVETSELLLIANPQTSFIRSGPAILVGQLFDSANERRTDLPPTIAEAANGSTLADMLSGHWGNFVLFRGLGEETSVYRDPSGSVSAYRCDVPGGTIFVSDAAFACELGIVARPSPDMRFAVHWLQYPFLRTRRTGLETITELLPGSLVAGRPGAWRESSAWNPSAFVGEEQAIDDPDRAAAELRAALLSVVARQSCGNGNVLRLSGGLDSSIIASCLSQAGVPFRCVNFATRSRDGDEREHARTVAGALATELVEVGEPEPGRLKRSSRPGFRPGINPLLAPFEQAIAEVTERIGASLLIDGGGGDNLFCSINTAAPVVDALLRGGLGQAWLAVGDIAGRAGCTAWEVLRAATRRALRPRRAWREDRSFLRGDALLDRPELHPWLEGLHAPPGKREHVEALVHVQHFLDRSDLTTRLLHPLLAQPLLELCLRIPSWFWMRGGRDRAVARDAFAGLLPASVLQRRMKGSLQSMLHRSFARLRADIRALLLDGELVRSGILDRAALEAALDGESWMRDEVQLRVSELAAMELWLEGLRSWPSHSSSGP